MAETYATLVTEFQARGYDYLDTTRISRFINRGYHMLCEESAFPFLEKEVTAQTAPLTIADLREILYVADATNDVELFGVDQRLVNTADPGRTATGNAQGWYITGGTVLNLYPADTAARLTVRYIKVPAELTGTDTPVVPTRYCHLIVDAAVYLALRDNDEYDSALALKQLWDYEVGRMIARLSVQNRQNPDTIVSTSTYPFPY